MMDYGSPKRYTVLDELDEMTSQLRQSRIEPLRGVVNNESHGELPSSESPFNPICYYDVQYTEPRLSQTNRVLTKYENKDASTVDIALYNTRTHALNAEDVTGLDNLQLHKQVMEAARSKVKQRYQDYVPQENSNSNVFNADIYNPGLPISATNQPTKTYAAGFVDERLGWHTNDRPFSYESDIANRAYNMQRSPEIIERNRRQAEADDALYHRHQKSRWVEPKQAYRVRAYDPQYSLDEFIGHDKSKYNDRQVGNIDKENYNTVIRSKHVHDHNSDFNRVRNEVNQSFEPRYRKTVVNNELQRRARLNDPATKRIQHVQEAFEPNNTKNGFFTNIASMLYTTVADSIKALLTPTLPRPLHPLVNERQEHQNRSPIVLCDNPNVYDPLFEQYKEKFGYKPQHLLLVRDGSIPAVYPDEDYSNTAPAFIQASPFDDGLSRMIVLFDDNKFKVIQKLQEDSIFRGDNRPIGSDYIISEIPIEDLPAQMRERIKAQNMNSKRDKALDLTYDDFIAFSDYVVRNIDTADRIKFADIWRKIRGNHFDEELVNNFEDRRMLVDETAVKVANAESRKLQVRDETKNRINVEQLGTVDQDDITLMRAAPLGMSNLPSSGEAFRSVQANNTPFATSRTAGANLRRFNV